MGPDYSRKTTIDFVCEFAGRVTTSQKWRRAGYRLHEVHPVFDCPLEQRTLSTVLRRAAESQPNAPFIIFRDRAYSYAEVDRLSTQLAHGLRGWGVGRGSRVALMLENSPQYILSLFAVAKQRFPRIGQRHPEIEPLIVRRACDTG